MPEKVTAELITSHPAYWIIHSLLHQREHQYELAPNQSIKLIVRIHPKDYDELLRLEHGLFSLREISVKPKFMGHEVIIDPSITIPVVERVDE